MNWRGFYRKNLWLKITALLIALVIWVNAVMNREVEIEYRVPVRVLNVPDSMVISDMSQGFVNVQLAGRTSEFLYMKLLNRSVYLNVDINDYEISPNEPIEVTLNDESFIFPGEPMHIEKTREREISIIIDSVDSKYVPIMPVIENTPAEGYMKYGAIVYSPEKVKITGGKRLISGIYHIETEPISMSGITRTFSVRKNVNDKYDFVIIEPKAINISIPVDKIERRLFADIPVEFINLPANMAMTPDSFLLDIEIEGPKSIVDNLFSGELAPLVDMSAFTKRGKYTIPVSINYENIHIISIKPESLEFILK